MARRRKSGSSLLDLSSMPLSFDNLPTVTAWFEAGQDEGVDSLLRAIGRLVWGASLLETVLRLLVIQLREERDGQYPAGEEFARLEEASAGRLLGLLRGLHIPADLEGRIGEVIDRRNEVVHRMFEMPEMVAAVVSGEGMDAVVQQIEAVALDCGSIGVKLFTVAGGALEAKMGKTPAELAEMLAGIDLEAVEDGRSRRQLESIRALSGVNLTFPWQAESGKDEADSSPPAGGEEG
jgi:hypothetical protein